MSKSSTSQKLRSELEKLIEKLASIIRDIPVKYSNHRGGDFVVLAPDYYWSKPNPEQEADLLAVKREYNEWFAVIQSTFRASTDDVDRKIQEVDKLFRKWLELKTNWSLRPSPDTNEDSFRDDIKGFNAILEILDATKGEAVLIIPDTNSLVAHPDPVDYREIAGCKSFTLLFLPTVLSELDELKNLHRNPDFRDKAKKVITRVKGYRKQGSLREGVKVDGSITVKAIANEPNMQDALSWLDPEVQDDRVIASVLEIQAFNPNAHIILVTGDINLLNKADAARICIDEL